MRRVTGVLERDLRAFGDGVGRRRELNSAPAIVVASPCHSGERLLLLRAAGGFVTENSPVAFASRTGKPRPIMTETEFRSALQTAGFGDIEITHTHRVHEHPGSAIIRARKLSP